MNEASPGVTEGAVDMQSPEGKALEMQQESVGQLGESSTECSRNQWGEPDSEVRISKPTVEDAWTWGTHELLYEGNKVCRAAEAKDDT